MMEERTVRLQKYLAERGIASRRKAAELVRAGCVNLDGQVVSEPGLRIDPACCAISVNGTPVGPARPAPRTIAFYKPRGYICSRATVQGRTIYELLGEAERGLVPVGRLDKDSEGLLLLSNDGALVHCVTHPRHGRQKTYRVTVSGSFSERTLATLRSEMDLDGYRIQPVEVTVLTRRPERSRILLQFTLREGRNRQIRKMCDQAGLTIHRLVRTAVGNVTLNGLRPGQWREIESAAPPARHVPRHAPRRSARPRPVMHTR